jgi:hypothetical protein
MAHASEKTAVAEPDRKVTFQQDMRSASSEDEAPEVDRVQMNSACSDGRGLDLPTEAEDGTSIAGDTASEAGDSETDAAVAAQRRRLRCAPERTYRILTEAQVPSLKNDDYPVGNASVYLGNWGTRGTVANTDEKKERRDIQDRQVLKNPCTILVLCEASKEMEDLLNAEARTPVPGAVGLAARPTAQYFVSRGNEESAVLIAARTDVASSLKCLLSEVHNDHAYKEKGKPKMARSRIAIVEVEFKQNVGYLGKKIVVAGVHGHNRTMKMEWAEALTAFWDRLATYIKTYDVKFLAGDFNMSLTEVVKQLRLRDIKCDCVAWHPWLHKSAVAEYSLGFDSCGIFYIGGRVEVAPLYGLGKIDQLLTAVADGTNALDVYEGLNYPGQPWNCYKRSSELRTDEKSLKGRLTDLLEVSTTTEELKDLPLWQEKQYCTYLRLKEKAMQRSEWLVGGKMHNGAHFPLSVFTKKSSSRSKDASIRRANKYNDKKSWKANSSSTAASSGQQTLEESQPSPAYSPPAVAETEQPWKWSGGTWSWYQ